MPKFKIIIKNNKPKKNISYEEYDNMSEEDRKEYIKDTRDFSGYRFDIIKKIMVMFEFETEDNMIDISFLYNLTDKELLVLYKLLYGEEVFSGKENVIK